MRAAALAAVAIALYTAAAAGQASVVIADRGPGASGRLLADALSRPHRLVEPDTGWFVLPRSESQRTTLIVLDRTAAIEGTVEGDVIVVGGDLFVRPGARITGLAVAIGGGVYSSTLSLALRGTRSFRDNTFTVERTAAGYRLSYRSLYEDAGSPLTLPGVYGVRMPSYDRVNGVSLPVGPAVTFGGNRGEAHAVVTYRSDLGKFDPSVFADFRFTRRLRLVGRAERGTFTNDAWIWPGFLNSLSALAFGTDTRNYYRGDRVEVAAHRLWESTTLQLEPLVGVRAEHAWTVGPDGGEQRGPWSVLGRTDSVDGMWRHNPPVLDGDIVSALAGGSARWEAGGVRAMGRLIVERSLDIAADNGTLTPSFVQLTSDFDVGFPTFGQQEYQLEAHWMTTPGNEPPPQRFAYFGGPGTMPWLELLEQGGDELLFLEQRYSIPLPKVRFGLLGSPTLQFRHRLGSAGVGALPTLEQMTGLGIHISLIRLELQLNPANGETRVSAGLTVSR